MHIIISEKRGAAQRPYRHETIEAARDEAVRLAFKDPADRFTIYEAIEEHRAPATVVTHISRPELNQGSFEACPGHCRGCTCDECVPF